MINIWGCLFADQFRDMFGHKFNIVTVAFFPFIDFYPDKDIPGSAVTMRDCLDARAIQTFSSVLNFTYVSNTF